MPAAVAGFCVIPGCGVRTHARRCAVHAVDREHGRTNWAWRRWYRTPRWKAFRLQILRDQGYACGECRQVLPRLEIDHKVKHNGDLGLFWDRANVWALCRECHQRKTQRGE